ncbi:MAG: hypothetical protein AMXMBFR55_09600 [Gemmatimonadota bacterium]
MRVITIAALVSLTAACAANPSPVHVAGATSEIDRLAGEWTGEYTSVETGRSGSITFTLRAGSDTAFGDVVMIPRALAPLPTAPRAPSGMTPTSPKVLSISFVRISANVVSGTLEPYPSPDCGCTLSTVFRGTLAGDRIEGTFTSTHSDPMAPAQQGRWWATRKSPGATAPRLPPEAVPATSRRRTGAP